MGAWIEIMSVACLTEEKRSRTPRWVRGLKLSVVYILQVRFMSHPTMGAWIEILSVALSTKQHSSRTPRWVRGLKFCSCCLFLFSLLSHPTMGAWIEITLQPHKAKALIMSHPTMGAWIEILYLCRFKIPYEVAPHDGCVD